MGGAISAAANQAAKEKAEEAKANLDQLMALGKKQQELFEKELIDYYMNPDLFGKYEVVGGRLVAKSSFLSAVNKEGTNKDIKDGVDSIIGGLFGLAGDEKEKEKSRDNFEKGCKSLVSGAFAAIIGESTASESEKKEFFIVPYGYTFYRIDVYMWKMNINAKAGVAEKVQSLTVTVAAMGVLETMKLHTDELIGFVTQIVGNDKKAIIQWFEDYIDIKKEIDKLKATDHDTLDAVNEIMGRSSPPKRKSFSLK